MSTCPPPADQAIFEKSPENLFCPKRVKLATGAYGFNLARARLLAPPLLQPLYAGLATSRRLPSVVASIARGLLLDSVYTEELDRQLNRGS